MDQSILVSKIFTIESKQKVPDQDGLLEAASSGTILFAHGVPVWSNLVLLPKGVKK